MNSPKIKRPFKTTPPAKFMLVRGQTPPRFFIHLVLNFLHRTDRERRELYFGELDLAVIAETVAVTALTPAARDQDFRSRFRDFTAVVGHEPQRPVNILSIANATGIPRETVRRKLKILVAKGALTEKDGGYIFKPGFAQQPHLQAAFDRGIRDTLQFMNDCLAMGVVRLDTASGQLKTADGDDGA